MTQAPALVRASNPLTRASSGSACRWARTCCSRFAAGRPDSRGRRPWPSPSSRADAGSSPHMATCSGSATSVPRARARSARVAGQNKSAPRNCRPKRPSPSTGTRCRHLCGPCRGSGGRSSGFSSMSRGRRSSTIRPGWPLRTRCSNCSPSRADPTPTAVAPIDNRLALHPELFQVQFTLDGPERLVVHLAAVAELDDREAVAR